MTQTRAHNQREEHHRGDHDDAPKISGCTSTGSTTRHLERVRFEIIRSPDEGHVFAFVNVGTEAVEGVEVDPTSVLAVAFRSTVAPWSLAPAQKWIFSIGEPDSTPRLPETIRITWSGPFEGQQHVPVPSDPASGWSYAM